MKPGKIIILNGTSRSGKTSIIKALQDVLEEPYLEAGIDKFIWMLQERYLDRPLWDNVLGLAAKAGDMGMCPAHLQKIQQSFNNSWKYFKKFG